MFETVLATIDLRSFSNAWFWIVLVLAWSNVTANLLGVPYDMVLRARRQGGQALEDLETLARIQARRRLAMASQSGVVMIVLWSGILTMSVTLGFRYGIEMGQALSFLLVPLAITVVLGLPLCRRIADASLTGEALIRALRRYRFWLIVLGLLSIVMTTLWGMIFNLVAPTLGR